MPLRLLYITNRPRVANIAAAAGVDTIFLDMEQLGKAERQRGLNSVQSHHTFADLRSVRAALTGAELLVRCNPVHDACEGYSSTEEEIEKILALGADAVMLPMWKSAHEVERFLRAVDGRARTVLLLETREADECLSDVLTLSGGGAFWHTHRAQRFAPQLSPALSF